MGLGVVDQLAIAEAGMEHRADVRGRSVCCRHGAAVAERRACAIHLGRRHIDGLQHCEQLVSVDGISTFARPDRLFRFDLGLLDRYGRSWSDAAERMADRSCCGQLYDDSALTTAAAEMKWMNGWSAMLSFEGEFSDVYNSYAGKAVVCYTW
jgi:hypothetical protein